MKKLLLVLAGISLLFSCKKNEEQKDSYTINGIHGISFGNQMSDTMSFSVDLISGGVKDTVELSIEGLPQDLSATLSNTSGIPTFSSLLTIKREESSGGIYYANLVGVSAGGKRKSYPVKVLVPPLRDIRFAGKYYKVTTVLNDSAAKTVLINAEQGLRLRLYLPESIANKAGIYKYRITDALPDPGTVQLKLWLGDEHFVPGYRGTNKIMMNLDSTGAITKLYLPDIELTTDTGPIAFKTLGINYNK